VEIDVGNLTPGIYLIKVQTGSGLEVQKMVIR
jgi:hypothetical protein